MDLVKPSTNFPPVAKSLPDLELGKAAEYLVVADLILQGYRAYLTDQGLPYDVVIDLDGRLIRMQVKATREQRPVPQRVSFTPGYLFHVRRTGKGNRRVYDQNAFDLLAFVALDIRKIAYMPFTDGLRQSIILRPPGYEPATRAERRGNIDQFPIASALKRWQDFTGLDAIHEETGQTFATMLTDRQN